jgi:hypothetical protein
MARALWSGAISFGLVTIPVKLYAAVEPRGELHFRLLHLRRREHLAALHPSGAALVLTTMRFADELRSAGALGLPPAGKGWSRKETWRAISSTVLRDLIDRKLKGERIATPKLERPRLTVIEGGHARKPAGKAGRRRQRRHAGRVA